MSPSLKRWRPVKINIMRTLATIPHYFLFMGHSKVWTLRITESTRDYDTALLQNLPQDLWSSDPFCLSRLTSHTPLHMPFVPITFWMFLYLPECSLSSCTSRPLHEGFLLPESLCPHDFKWRTQTFVKNLQCYPIDIFCKFPRESYSTLSIP